MLGFPKRTLRSSRDVHVIIEAIDQPEEFASSSSNQWRSTSLVSRGPSRESRDDLTTFLLNAEIDGQKLAVEHVFGTMVLILVAGIDTPGPIGASLWHLAQHPDDLAAW